MRLLAHDLHQGSMPSAAPTMTLLLDHRWILTAPARRSLAPMPRCSCSSCNRSRPYRDPRDRKTVPPPKASRRKKNVSVAASLLPAKHEVHPVAVTYESPEKAKAVVGWQLPPQMPPQAPPQTARISTGVALHAAVENLGNSISTAVGMVCPLTEPNSKAVLRVARSDHDSGRRAIDVG